MANFIERSVMLTIGVAAVMREIADSLTEELVKRGEATTQEGRQVFDEAVDKARDEARGLRDRFDSQVQRGYRDMGIASSGQMEEMQLKIAQLEHRVSLLEKEHEMAAGDENGGAPVNRATAG